MFGSNQVMSSFSSNDIPAAKAFYSDTLGFDVEEQFDGLLLKFGGGGQAMVYPKSNHEPATFTVLHIIVDDVEKAVDDLTAKGDLRAVHRRPDQDRREGHLAGHGRRHRVVQGSGRQHHRCRRDAHRLATVPPVAGAFELSAGTSVTAWQG